jgi:hypothetical protein
MERLDTMTGCVHDAQDRRPASVRFQREASMTDAELRIIELLEAPTPLGPPISPTGYSPLEGDRLEDLRYELITAASLI